VNNLEEMVRVVRKHGALILKDRVAATRLVDYAKQQYGYTFKSNIRGWNYILSDEDF
jgi:hypothetical protein